MGHIEETFASALVDAGNEMNGQMFTAEKAENFHVHWRNYRLVFNREEFEFFLKGMMTAYRNWVDAGKPHANPGQPVDEPPEYYLQTTVKPERAEPQKNDEWRKVMVELQQYAEWAKRDDFMHVHYKDLRIDLTISEFIGFASVIEDGKRHLTKWMRNKKGDPGKQLLDVKTEIYRDNRGLAMVFLAEMDIKMVMDNWNSMYSHDGIRARDEYKELYASMKKNGMSTPIRYALTCEDNHVWGSLLDGHHRVLAASDLGWSRILVQFEVWVNREQVKDRQTLKNHLLAVFGDEKMIELAFEKNRIKLDFENLIF